MARPHASCRIAQETVSPPVHLSEAWEPRKSVQGSAKARFRPIDPLVPPAANVRNLRGTAAESRLELEPDQASPLEMDPAQLAQFYISVCSANSKASSTSMPR